MTDTTQTLGGTGGHAGRIDEALDRAAPVPALREEEDYAAFTLDPDADLRETAVGGGRGAGQHPNASAAAPEMPGALLTPAAAGIEATFDPGSAWGAGWDGLAAGEGPDHERTPGLAFGEAPSVLSTPSVGVASSGAENGGGWTDAESFGMPGQTADLPAVPLPAETPTTDLPVAGGVREGASPRPGVILAEQGFLGVVAADLLSKEQAAGGVTAGGGATAPAHGDSQGPQHAVPVAPAPSTDGVASSGPQSGGGRGRRLAGQEAEGGGGAGAGGAGPAENHSSAPGAPGGGTRIPPDNDTGAGTGSIGAAPPTGGAGNDSGASGGNGQGSDSGPIQATPGAGAEAQPPLGDWGSAEGAKVEAIDAFDVSAPSDVDATPDRITETAEAGASTGIRVFAVDADLARNTVTYTVSDARFSVDADGTVRVAQGAVFDAETESSIGLTVTATSVDGSTASQAFTLNVSDVNEHRVTAPVDVDHGANTLSEHARAGAVTGLRVQASDADATQSSVTFTVSDARFSVDPDGTVRVAQGASFDAETESSIGLTVTATSVDGSTASQAFSLNVSDVNEHAVSAPVDVDAAGNTLSEHALAGAATGLRVHASDADATQNTVSYSVRADRWEVDDDGTTFTVSDARFSVDPDGTVRVAQGAVFDAETESSINLTVTATSADGSTASNAFVLNVADVNEHRVTAPVDVDRGANTLSEHARAGAATGLRVQASDADATQSSVTFTVSDTRFSVDRDGTVRVAQGAAFDAETESSISLNVTATSADGSSASQAFTLNVSDVNEHRVTAPVDVDRGANTLSEHARAGAATGLRVQASDADATQSSVAFTVSDARFSVDRDGTVRVAQGAAFDAETESSISLNVTATSADGSSASQAFTLNVSDVNEHRVTAPVDVDPGANTLSEHARAGTATGLRVQAVDGDATQSSVTFTVSDARFSVDRDGTVRVAQGAVFDAETESSINLTVTATSADGSTASNAFVLNVADVNEHRVTAPVDVDRGANTLSEHARAGAATGLRVQASDADATQSSVTFTVSDARFSVDRDGTVRVAQGAAFDAETESSINLTVTATSADGSTASNAFVLNVADENEHRVTAPVDIGTDANGISEWAAPGSATGLRVQAVDADATQSAVSFTVSDARFSVDADGTVRVAAGAVFDAASESNINLTVMATSADGSSSSNQFGINVADESAMEEPNPGTTPAPGPDSPNQDPAPTTAGQTLRGTSRSDHIEGGAGSDRIMGGNGDDRLFGHDGNDVINGGNQNDQLHGGEGNDQLFGGNHNDLLVGGAGDDLLHGGNHDDSLLGGEGNDRLLGGSGNDSLSGWDGDDFLSGGSGNDSLSGENGNDVLHGGSGDDRLHGGLGNDALHGDAGNDLLSGEAGDDRLFGGAGTDRLFGGDGNDHLDGGAGDDFLSGMRGDDVIHGGTGRDSLTGGDGNDTLWGGAGDGDIANGGTGDDLFLFRHGDGRGDSAFGGDGRDVLRLEGADGGAVGAGWTFSLTSGSVSASGENFLELSADAQGTLTLADGSSLDFQQIERIAW
ncbi:MAG TPA: hypothetical protein DCY89_06335 [Gammaproteobacteria bacterium]|nr:hypothetical protein [Gammaproteobacteria bacterium]